MDHIQLKILIVGDSGVGKSCLMMRYTDDTFDENFITTIGVDFKKKLVNIQNRQVTMQIWDTAGQERFRTLTESFYRGAHGIFICYDATCPRSFANVLQWFSEINDHQHQTAQPNLMLVATKCDRDAGDLIQVDRNDAIRFANEKNCKFIETSAKHNIHVNEMFCQMATDLIVSSNEASNAHQFSSNQGGGIQRISGKTSNLYGSQRKCCG